MSPSLSLSSDNLFIKLGTSNGQVQVCVSTVRVQVIVTPCLLFLFFQVGLDLWVSCLQTRRSTIRPQEHYQER
jgi:hypothetical protein